MTGIRMQYCNSCGGAVGSRITQVFWCISMCFWWRTVCKCYSHRIPNYSFIWHGLKPLIPCLIAGPSCYSVVHFRRLKNVMLGAVAVEIIGSIQEAAQSSLARRLLGRAASPALFTGSARTAVSCILVRNYDCCGMRLCFTSGMA
jgi:hypothetical protein